MEVIKYPSREEWASLVQRPALDVTTLFDTVRMVLDEVRREGDAAVIRYEEKFDYSRVGGSVVLAGLAGANALVLQGCKFPNRN